jgi:hypothetical protein
MRVGFFSYSVLVLYIAFIPPETMDRWLLALRARRSRRSPPRNRPQDAPS